MKILNLLWGFSTGGIGRCFLSYNKLGEADTNITVHSVCIDIESRNHDLSFLKENDIETISIKSVRDFSWIRKVGDQIERARPDIILCHGFNGPVIVWAVKKRYKISTPMVCTYHGVYHPPKAIKKLVAPIYNAAQVFLYRNAAQRVITVENQSVKLLQKKGVAIEKLATVPNGIPDKLPVHDSYGGGETIRFCTVSRLDRVKGLHFLVEALSLLDPDLRQNIRVDIIGDGPEYHRLNLLVKRAGLENVIEFRGYQRNVEEWLEKSDVLLLPSLYECHSVSLLEAMRAGKAIVTTAVGGTPDTIRDGVDGYLIPPANSKALADAIATLVLSPELIRRLGNSARERFLSRFTETMMLENFVNVLRAES